MLASATFPASQGFVHMPAPKGISCTHMGGAHTDTRRRVCPSEKHAHVHIHTFGNRDAHAPWCAHTYVHPYKDMHTYKRSSGNSRKTSTRVPSRARCSWPASLRPRISVGRHSCP